MCNFGKDNAASIISMNTNRIEPSFFGDRFFGAEQELFVFKVSEFEIKLKNIGKPPLF